MGFNSGFKGLKITANHDRSTLHSLSTAVIRIKETSLYKCIERLRNAVLGTENFCNSRCKICAEDVRNSFRFLLLVSWQKTPKVMVRGWQGHLVCKKFKYWKSKFSQNTTNLLSKWTCFDSMSRHHQANYWNMFEVHQVKVHIWVPKFLQQCENVGTIKVDISNIIYNKMYPCSLFFITFYYI